MTLSFDSQFCRAFALADPQSHREFTHAYYLYTHFDPQSDILSIALQRISNCFSPETRSRYPTVVADTVDTMRFSLFRSFAREQHLDIFTGINMSFARPADKANEPTHKRSRQEEPAHH